MEEMEDFSVYRWCKHIKLDKISFFEIGASAVCLRTADVFIVHEEGLAKLMCYPCFRLGVKQPVLQ